MIAAEERGLRAPVEVAGLASQAAVSHEPSSQQQDYKWHNAVACMQWL